MTFGAECDILFIVYTHCSEQLFALIWNAKSCSGFEQLGPGQRPVDKAAKEGLMAHNQAKNMSYFSFRVQGGKPTEGINAPLVYESPGKQPRRGIILGPRQRTVLIDRGQEQVVYRPRQGAQTLLGSADSRPVYERGKFTAGSITTVGRHHFVVRPVGDGKYSLFVQTGLPTNPRLALEEYDKLQKVGKLPTAHGYLIDDGTLALASVEADESISADGEETPASVKEKLVKHIRWAVSRDRVPSTDIPLWREDFLYASPGAEIYVFGSYGEQTHFILQKDGSLRQESDVPTAARLKFDEQEIDRIAKRAAERKARAAKRESAVVEEAAAPTDEPKPKGLLGRLFS